jgi:hypothetical protein
MCSVTFLFSVFSLVCMFVVTLILLFFSALIKHGDEFSNAVSSGVKEQIKYIFRVYLMCA